MSEKMELVRRRIKERRQELELSYQELAEKTDMSKSTLQRYETAGIKNLSIDKLEVLARALNVTPNYLMGWTTPAAISDYYDYVFSFLEQLGFKTTNDGSDEGFDAFFTVEKGPYKERIYNSYMTKHTAHELIQLICGHAGVRVPVEKFKSSVDLRINYTEPTNFDTETETVPSLVVNRFKDRNFSEEQIYKICTFIDFIAQENN